MLPSFPRKQKQDDAQKYTAAKARHAALVEAADTVGRGQVLRFERAMREQRAWTVADFRAHVLSSPLLQHLARRLAWQFLDDATSSASGEGGLLFRVAEDLTLANAEDERIAFPPDDARVVIAHPLRAPKLLELGRWIEDYLVVQPFPQVGRDTFALSPHGANGATITRAKGRSAAYLSVLTLPTERGWKPVPPGTRASTRSCAR